jgi:hypothetical protein
LRRGWDRVDATLVDSRFVERKLRSADGRRRLGYGWVEEQEKRREQRDDERFEARLAGREPEPDPDENAA